MLLRLVNLPCPHTSSHSSFRHPCGESPTLRSPILSCYRYDRRLLFSSASAALPPNVARPQPCAAAPLKMDLCIAHFSPSGLHAPHLLQSFASLLQRKNQYVPQRGRARAARLSFASHIISRACAFASIYLTHTRALVLYICRPPELITLFHCIIVHRPLNG